VVNNSSNSSNQMIQQGPTVTIPEALCCIKRCFKKDTPPLMRCSLSKCKKSIHYSCYKDLLLLPLSDPNDNELVVCSRTCYKKVQKDLLKLNTTGNNPRLLWEKDGKLGPNDPNNSLNILLKWLLTEGNYSKYRGKDTQGKKKKDFAEDIARKIKDEGVLCERTAKEVINKIEHIERCFRSAHDFANSETGAGLKRQSEGTFNDAIRQKCPWYFELFPIFQDRASARAKLTNEDDLDSSISLDANLPDESDDCNVPS